MRYLAPQLREALADGKMAFIAGPRQVGKTTMAQRLLEEAPARGGYFNWDHEPHRRLLTRQPDSFWQQAATQKARVVLDEIHKYPRWKRFLKGLYDTQSQQLELLVTGSGRLDIYQRGGDSLLGRYRLGRLHPFTSGEWLADGEQRVKRPDELMALLQAPEAVSGAEEALSLIENFSGFPEPLFKAKAAHLRVWRRARRALVLREDLRDLSRIRDLGLVDQLVLLLPERVGSLLSINSLREDLGVAFDTVKNWLAALAKLNYVFELRPFSGKLARTLKREGKLYLYDHTEIESDGARFENVVALALAKLIDAWNDAGEGDFSLHYVRDKDGREVDFVIVNNKKPFLLIETKLTDAALSPALAYFHARLKPKMSVQLVRRGSFKRHGELLVLPASHFLSWI